MVDREARLALRRTPFKSHKGSSAFERVAIDGLRPDQRHNGLIDGSYLQRSVESFFANTGFIRPAGGGGEDVTDPFLESWVVYTCCALLADKVASIPLQVWSGPGEDAKQVGEGDPVVRRLMRPNRDVTWSQFAARGVIHRRLSGEDLWFLMDLKGNPKVQVEKGAEAMLPAFDLPEQIVNVSGHAVEDDRDPSTGRITHWRYSGGTKNPPPFPAASVIHFADYDPADPQRGLGAAEAAARAIAGSFQAERYQEAMLRTGHPGGFLIAKQGMLQDEEDALQARMDDAARDPNNANRLKLLTGDWDFKANTVPPKDMVALDWLKWWRDVIAHVMRVPLPCIGVLDQSTYNNLDTAWREFWNGVRDYLNGAAEVMNSAFFPRLKGPGSGYRCSFDFSKVPYLNQLDTARIELALKIAQAGQGVSLNDALAALKVEIDPIKGGDRQLIGAMNLSADAFDDEELHSVYLKPEGETAPATPAADETKPKKAARPRRKLKHPALAEPKVRAEYHSGWLIRAGVHRHERRLALSVKRYLAAYERAQIARLRHVAEKGVEGLQPNPPLEKAAGAVVTKIGVDEIERWLLLYKRDWEAELGKATSRILASAFESAAFDAARELAVEQIPGTDPRVLAFLKDQEIQLTEGVTSSLAQRVKLQLVDVLQESTNTADLQLAVREMLPELTDSMRKVFGTKEARALTIARTEAAHSANGAKFMQYREAGVAQIQWVSEGDDIVRESHAPGTGVDGDIVAMGEPFANGLLYPTDPSGPAAEVINCRCGFVAVDEEG